MVLDDLQHTSPAEALEDLGVWVLASPLGLPEREARDLPDLLGESPEILPARPDPEERPGDLLRIPDMPEIA
jgi:hypothetical protein